MNKKMYIKPAVSFEPLNMASNVASGCAIVAHFEEFACPVTVPEWGITFYGENNCEFSTPDANDMICYHVPTGAGNVFTS